MLKIGDTTALKVIWHPSHTRLQNTRILCVGPAGCARSSNERSGASVKTERGTGPPLARFVRDTFPRHASWISQG